MAKMLTLRLRIAALSSDSNNVHQLYGLTNIPSVLLYYLCSSSPYAPIFSLHVLNFVLLDVSCC